jgi:hypothetical protein
MMTVYYEDLYQEQDDTHTARRKSPRSILLSLDISVKLLDQHLHLASTRLHEIDPKSA